MHTSGGTHVACVSDVTVRKCPLFSAAASYSWDLEADTTPDRFGQNNGLRPLKAPITEIAFACDVSVLADGGTVWASSDGLSEADMIVEFFTLMSQLDPGVHDTWNGLGYDLAFLWTRSEILGLDVSRWLRLFAQPGLVTRRPVAEPHTHPYTGVIAARGGVHQHYDASTAYLRPAKALGIAPGLKSVATVYGLAPIEVDRERMQDLTPQERRAYALSDARCTRLLGMHARGLNVPEVRDPLFSGVEQQYVDLLDPAHDRFLHEPRGSKR